MVCCLLLSCVKCLSFCYCIWIFFITVSTAQLYTTSIVVPLLSIYVWVCHFSIVHSIYHSVIIIQYFYFVAIKCFGILISCILNFSIVHSNYRSVVIIQYFYFLVIKCFGILISCILNSSIVHSNYRSVAMFWYF